MAQACAHLCHQRSHVLMLGGNGQSVESVESVPEWARHYIHYIPVRLNKQTQMDYCKTISKLRVRVV